LLADEGRQHEQAIARVGILPSTGVNAYRRGDGAASGCNSAEPGAGIAPTYARKVCVVFICAGCALEWQIGGSQAPPDAAIEVVPIGIAET
jgi:hypothetical protein